MTRLPISRPPVPGIGRRPGGAAVLATALGALAALGVVAAAPVPAGAVPAPTTTTTTTAAGATTTTTTASSPAPDSTTTTAPSPSGSTTSTSTTTTTPGLSTQAAAQMAALETQITQNGQLLDTLAQSYEENTAAITGLEARLASSRATLALGRKRLASARLALRAQALTDYMDEAGPNGMTQLFSGGIEGAAFEEYRSVAAGDENDAITRYAALAQGVADESASLQRQDAVLATTLDQIGTERQSASAAVTVQQGALTSLAAQDGFDGVAFTAAQQDGAALYGALVAPGSAAAANVPAAVLDAVSHAESQLAVPYVWGGETPGPGPGAGFDCSGLVQWAYGAAGITLPRTAEEQYQATTAVPVAQARPGDLAFFNDGTPSVQHVAIYLGSGMVLQAPSTGQVVSYYPMWTDDLVGFGRAG